MPKLNEENSIMGDWSTIRLGTSYEGGGGSWAKVISSSWVMGVLGDMGAATMVASGDVGRVKLVVELDGPNVWTVRPSIGTESESCLDDETEARVSCVAGVVVAVFDSEAWFSDGIRGVDKPRVKGGEDIRGSSSGGMTSSEEDWIRMGSAAGTTSGGSSCS